MTAGGLRFVVEDFSDARVLALIEHHLREADRNSPPGSAFAFDLSGLRHPAITLWSAWRDDTLVGMGALRTLEPDKGEIKSMRVAPGQGGKGVGGAILAHMIDEARARGMRRLLLETGTSDPYVPARRLYEGAGFLPCGPFGDYALTEFNRCYALTL